MGIDLIKQKGKTVMDLFWKMRGHLLTCEDKQIKIKPALIEGCRAIKLDAWHIDEADAFLTKQFKAKLMQEEFRTVFGNVNDYLIDDTRFKEYIYEIDDQNVIERLCSHEWEKEARRQDLNNAKVALESCQSTIPTCGIYAMDNNWRFSIRCDENQKIVDYYCIGIASEELLGYILLFTGYNIQSEKFQGDVALGYLDFLLNKGIIKPKITIESDSDTFWDGFS